MPNKMDPIAVEVIGNHFRCMTDEMGITLVKSAYSTNIKERRDCSAGLLDARGGTVALTAYTTSHIGSMLGLQDQLFQRYPVESIEPGDIFMANDPFSGGPTHLPDITLTAPYFHNCKLVFFLATVGHHTEIGGGLGAATDIWSEGLRIPLIKLFSRGELREDIFNMILLNVRNPAERRGDLEAQIAGLRIGQRRLDELFTRYSDIAKALSATETRDVLKRQGLEPKSTTPRHFADFMSREVAQNFKLISAAGIRSE